MVSLEFSESYERTDDNYSALHPLSAAEHSVILCSEVTDQASVKSQKRRSCQTSDSTH